MVKEEVKEQTQKKDLRYYLVQSAILLLVVALGVLAVNQALEYKYRAEFLKAPCALCVELNPEVKDCFISKRHVYPGLLGDWVDPTDNKCYGLDNKEVACKGNHNLNTTLNLSSFIIP